MQVELVNILFFKCNYCACFSLVLFSFTGLGFLYLMEMVMRYCLRVLRCLISHTALDRWPMSIEDPQAKC